MDTRFELFGGQRYRRKVRAIVVDTQQAALLIQPHGYAADNWTLVGGGVELGETPSDAMRRELAEEVGLVELQGLWPLAEVHRFVFDERTRLKRGLDHDGQSALLFVVRVAAGVPIRLQAEEVNRHCWVPLKDAPQHMLVAAQREWLQRALTGAAPRLGLDAGWIRTAVPPECRDIVAP